MLEMLYYKDATGEDMLHCASMWSEANMFFQQSPCSGSDEILYHLQHEFAWAAGKVYGSGTVFSFLFWGLFYDQ